MKKVILAGFLMSIMSVTAYGVEVSDFNAFKDKLSVLRTLIESCEEKCIPTDEEKINYTVIEDFIKYGNEDLSNGCNERAEYVYECLNELYEEAYKNLNGYLDGEKKSIKTYKYKSGDIALDGTSFITNRDDGKGGMFFVGYMGDVENIDKKLVNLGTNIITLETGVWNVIIPPGENIYGGWKVDADGNGALVQREEKDGQNGTAGLKFVNNSGSVRVTKTLYIEPYTEYEIGCVSRNISGGGIEFSSNRTASSVLKNTSSRFATSKFSFSSGGNTSLTIEFLSESVGENIIDGVFVRKKGTYDNILTSGDFEKDVIHKDGYDVDAGALDEIIRSAETAEENNIFVNLLISPHYFPSFIESESGAYTHGGSGFGGGGIEWSEQRIQDVMRDYASAVGESIKNCNAIKSVCLMNEPMFNLMYSNSAKIQPLWKSWLEEKYGTIGNLNDNHMSLHSSFSRIPTVTGISATQAFYDWKQFNEEYFAGFHKMLADEIKSKAPKVMIHSKMVDYMSRIDSNYEYKFMLAGTEANLFSDFSDLHGNDAHAYIGEHMYQMESKLLWYDYLTTVDEKPVFNSEDHIIQDKSKDYSEKQAIHVACDIWQGALHGRGASTIWVYRRTYDESSLVMDSILHRPDCMAAVGKTNLKLNSVADEINKLQNAKPKVGVVFSTASRVYNRNYMNCLYKAYQAANYSGYRVSVLDEKALADGKADGLKLIILPDTRYIPVEAVEALAEYVSNGGKIIALGDSCLRYDDYKKGISSSLKSAVLDNAKRFSVSYKGYELISPSADEILESIRDMTPNEVEIKASSDGKKLSGTEYRWIDCGRGKLLNICRYEWEDLSDIDIYIGGNKATYVYDMVKGEELSRISLKGYTPLLLYVETGGVIKEENGVVYAENTEASDKIIQALYDSDGKLIKCEVAGGKERITLFGKEENQVIKIMIWDKLMKPLSVVSDF